MDSNRSLKVLEFLSFKLGKEEFSLDILQVREVLKLKKLTKIPKTPTFMKGIINLRGSVVTVVGLREKFNMPSFQPDEMYVIIIEIFIEGELVIIGALVDSVQEVVQLNTEQIEPPPKLGTTIKTDFIKGLGKYNDDFLILLDIERLFSMEELSIMKDTKEMPPPVEAEAIE